MLYLSIALIVFGVGLILYYVFADSFPVEGASSPAARGDVGLPGASGVRGRSGRVAMPPSASPAAHAAESVHRRHVRAGVQTLGAGTPGAFPEIQGPPPLALQGILFLKPDRGSDSNDLLADGERLLGQVRRVGEATLLVEGGRFLIRSGDASFSYSANDLDEVRFEQGGFSLIPVDRNRPVPVFLTERPDELKEYLRKHSLAGAR